MQSPAKRRRCDLTDEDMSFMYSKNRTGPKIEPCETPESTGLEEDLMPFTEADWERFDKKASIHISLFPRMP